jgi:tetratricopeptide (TPR) repeat protein
MTARGHRFCGIFLCCAVLLGGCGQPGDQNGLDDAAIHANNRGVGLMGRFDYEAAQRVFRELAERYPQQPDIQVNLAIALLNRQQGDDETHALQLLQKVVAAHPDHQRARYCSGLLEFRRGEAAVAAQQFRAVLATDPGDPYAAYFLAQSLQQQGDTEGALQWYRRALEADPYLRSA